jgi:precorrin-6B methylase 2
LVVFRWLRGVLLHLLAVHGVIPQSPLEKEMAGTAGVKAGDAVLDEGFGLGTSSIVAARIVGPGSRVYALDNEPIHVLILWLRARIRRLKNLKVLLSDADPTGLLAGSVDVACI